ncbi:recombinase family protein [Microbacterium sp. NPDC057407]|uniref:recombinase family protein n=1 Tax=Microbacterium sp. NPDC057407 TaxID=3346120 RepID=UPI00367062A6
MASRKIGYSRPLHAGESLDAELESLASADVLNVVVEPSPRSGSALAALIAGCESGDTVVVSSLDRLADQVGAMVAILVELADRGIVLDCLSLPDARTADPTVVTVLRELDAASRRLRSRRTRHGMQTSGNRPGRPPALSPEQVAVAAELRRFDRSYAHIARVLGVSTSAVQRALAR